MTRDPRVDPRPGDVLWLPSIGLFWRVESYTREMGWVVFHDKRSGGKRYGNRSRLDLEVWRTACADAEIVKVAE